METIVKQSHRVNMDNARNMTRTTISGTNIMIYPQDYEMPEGHFLADYDAASGLLRIETYSPSEANFPLNRLKRNQGNSGISNRPHVVLGMQKYLGKNLDPIEHTRTHRPTLVSKKFDGNLIVFVRICDPQVDTRMVPLAPEVIVPLAKPVEPVGTQTRVVRLGELEFQNAMLGENERITSFVVDYFGQRIVFERE